MGAAKRRGPNWIKPSPIHSVTKQTKPRVHNSVLSPISQLLASQMNLDPNGQREWAAVAAFSHKRAPGAHAQKSDLASDPEHHQ